VQEARGSKADDKQASTAPLVSKATPVPMPADEVACRARLKAANVSFKEHEPLSDPLGCSSPYPISLDDLGLDIALEPAAVLNCHMAEAAVTYTRDVIAPLAAAEFETRLKGIRQASAYVCRPRNGTTKLSEHAFGNALDIAAFILEDGAEIPVEATRERERSEFLSRVRSKACGPFKTVLGPGSDADHATHFHLDLAQRRRGGTFCQ
ncbi:MAG: extensin family protein, partial [Rhizobiaceae bacterium]